MEQTEIPSSYFVSTILPKISKNVLQVTFSWYDYILFTLMLFCSTLIGIYFGCFGSKQATTNEYLMGGRTMKVIPIAISLVASHVSGITLLALPADIYRYGAAYWLGSFSMILLCAVTMYVYLPVFFTLQITSTYEYLEKRFDHRLKLLSSFLFALSVFLYLPIVVYIPALAFAAATGANVHAVTPVVCAICIFYTTIGGLKAVVWTDTLQFTVTVGAVGTVFVLGVKSAGGFSQVWNKAIEGGRLDIFDFSFDPTKRDSVWIILIGLTVHWMGHTSVNQSYVQKFLSVATLKESKRAVVYFGIGMNIIKASSVLTGLLMFAKYADCDPFTTRVVTRNDQLLPYYVMDVAKSIPGLSGLFIAGVFSAALSTLSATLNCLAGTIYKDFVTTFVGESISEKTASNILKLIVIITGLACTALVFVIEHLGGLLPLAIGLGGVTNGPLLGLFTLGMLFPKANAKGAFYGAICGLIFIGSIVFPAKYYESHGYFKYPPKPLSTDGCDFINETVLTNLSLITTNITSSTATIYPILNAADNSNFTSSFEPHFIFKISFYYYTLIGAAVTMMIGLVVSYMTNKNDPPIDRALISPVCHFLLPKDTKLAQNLHYTSVDRALHIVKNDTEKGIL